MLTQFHDQRSCTVEQQLKALKSKKDLQQQHQLQLNRWKRYSEYYVRKKKEESALQFKRVRSEINKKCYTNKAHLNKSGIPSADELAKKEELRNGAFLRKIRASPVQHCMNLRSCISQCSKLDESTATSADEEVSAVLIIICVYCISTQCE